MIYTATDDYYEDFKRMFAAIGEEVEVLPTNHEKVKDCSLLIFTGGEDVHPSFYSSEREWGDWYNKARDEFELNLCYEIMNGNFRPKKVLGVCRGIQLINVAMGGTLVLDIEERYGRQHDGVHKITWAIPNIFDGMSTVNSLHHEAVRSIGGRVRPRTLAHEPLTKVVESVLWGNTYFGVQWHPEFFHGKAEEERNDFSRTLMQWVNGKEFFSPKSKISSEETDEQRLFNALKGTYTVSSVDFDED